MPSHLFRYSTKQNSVNTPLWGATKVHESVNISMEPANENQVMKGSGFKINEVVYCVSACGMVFENCFSSLTILASCVFKDFDAYIEDDALHITSAEPLNFQNLNPECDIVGALGFTCRIMIMEE